MKKQDRLGDYMKELPREEPSVNFTKTVMARVRVETKKAPVEYPPLISQQVWWKIFIGLAFLVISAIVYRTYFPGNETPTVLSAFYQIDFSIILKPFQLLSHALSNLSQTVVAGSLAISVLLLIDLLYSHLIRR